MENEKTKKRDDEIISELLTKKILFSKFLGYCYHGENDIAGQTICLFVNCNDLFSFGCADAQEVNSSDDLYELYESYQKDPEYGIDFWCCKKRDLQPQKIIKDIWKKNGAWNDELEKLRPNPE